MALNIENTSGSTLDINDFGITLAIGEIIDLSTRVGPMEITESATNGDLNNLITVGTISVKDPIDGTTALSVADGLATAQSANEPHWRFGSGSRLGDISDVDLTGEADTVVLQFDSGSGTYVVATPSQLATDIAINDLTDVDTTGITTDDILQWNGTTFIAADPATVGSGASFTLEWRFSTSIIAADPGNGRFRYDNIVLASVTNIYFDDFADSGFDVGTVFSTLGSGDKIYLQQNSDATKAVLFTLSGTPTDNIGWWTVPVTVDGSGTLHDNNAKCAAIFFQSGAGGSGNVYANITGGDGGTAVAIGSDTITVNGTGINITATDAGAGLDTLDLVLDVADLTAGAGTILATDEFAINDGGTTVRYTVQDLIDDLGISAGGDDLAGVCAQIAFGDGDQILGTNTFDTVNFPTTQFEDDVAVVSHDPVTNNSRLTFSEAGNFLVYFNATLDPPGGTATFTSRIIKNGVLTPLPGSERIMNEDAEANDLTNIIMWTAAANDYLELQIRSDIVGSAVGETTNFGATRMRGSKGAAGADGADGAPGSGSTITLEEGGVAVTNTPHDTIDFDATDFDVTDNGDGSATITVIGGGGLAVDMATAQARRTTTYTVTGAWADITHDATDVENDTAIVEHDNTNTERLTLKDAGAYLIYYGLSVTATSGTSEAFVEVESRVQVNGLGGALGGSTDMVEQIFDSSIVGDNTLQQNMVRSFVYEATANDFVALQMQFQNQIGTLTLGATQIVFGAIRLQGTGGGSIAVQEEGVTVTGGPHDTLNFIGSSVTATDATGGVAAITITDQNLFETVTPDTGGNIVADTATDTLTLAGGTGVATVGTPGTDTITFNTVDSEIVHDNLSGFVADEHVAHTGVVLTAGSGLAGGGDISVSRTFDLDINSLAVATIAAGDFVPFWDITVTATNKKLTFANLEATLDHNNLTNTHNLTTDIDHNTILNNHNLTTDIDHNTILNNHNLTTDIDHDLLTNFVAGEHILHTGVVLTAGSGLAGGGDISASRTFDLDINSLAVATIAAGDFVPFWDITATATNKKLTFANLEATLDHNNLTNTHNLTTDIDHDLLTNFVADEHVAHTGVTLTAGAGLTGGGDISASRTFDVVGGQGITANADDIELDYTVATVTAVAGDFIQISDASNAGAVRKVDASDFLGGADALAAVQARRTTAYTLTTAFVDITLDTTDEETDATVVEHNNTNTDDIDIKEAGTYLIRYEGDTETAAAANNTNIQMEARVRLNDVSVLPGSEAMCASFEDNSVAGSEGPQHLSNAFIATLAASDKVTLQLSKVEISGASVYAAERISFQVIKLEGVRGPTGPTGPTGSGSNITLEDEDVAVTNTPHSTLNFTGTGVTVTDAGAGQADITIPGSSSIAAVQARRTTTFTPTTAWQDVTLDATDIENDAASVEHNNTNTDRIDLIAAGLYRISARVDFDSPSAGAMHAEAQLRVRVNDTTVINGSDTEGSIFNDSSIEGNLFTMSLSSECLYQATASDFITLQIQHVEIAGTPDETTRAGGIVLIATRLGD